MGAKEVRIRLHANAAPVLAGGRKLPAGLLLGITAADVYEHQRREGLSHRAIRGAGAEAIERVFRPPGAE